MRVEKRGMVVNDQKTGLMCISASRSFDSRAVLKGGKGEEITGLDCLKFLGFTLDADCSITTHIDKTCKNLRARKWALNLLKKAGMSRTDLTKVNTTILRPIAEYACVVGIQC